MKIKFRGKTKQGEKVEGDLLQDKRIGKIYYYIIENAEELDDGLFIKEYKEILPETLNQYTNININDIESYENDLIGISKIDHKNASITLFAIFQIVWSKNYACWDIKWIKGSQSELGHLDIYFNDYDYSYGQMIENLINSQNDSYSYGIIGNILDAKIDI